MNRKIIACFLSFLFLMGSACLPFCDFSLARDIPKMYQSYEKLTTPEEVGIVDFIGDYLFAGKALLGHNKNDKPENATTSVQFQHTPAGFNFVYTKLVLPCISVGELRTHYTKTSNPIKTREFHPELFRPPLT